MLQKRWIRVAAVATVLVVLAVVVTPFFVNADTFRPKIENELSSSLNRKVTLGHLSFSLLRGSLIANDISIGDDPAFSSAPFLRAKELHLGVEIGQFLFHHSVHITGLIVDAPEIHLIHAQDGRWNFSSIGSKRAKPTPQQESVLPALSMNELRIKNGSATLATLPANGSPFACTAINLSVKQFSFLKSFPFEIALKTAGDGTLSLKGTAGPIAQNDASETPFQAALEIKHFDPVAAHAVAAGDGIGMLADFNARIASDGTNLSSTGKIVASRLQLARGGSPAPKPVNFDYAISENMNERIGQITDITVHAGSAAAHVNGSYRLSGGSVFLNLRLAAPSLPVDQLEELLPAVGVNLPSGSKLNGGTLTANLAITGPVSAMTLTGPVELDNSRLAGFDLGSKIQGINPLKGTGGGTEIEKLSAEVDSTPQSTQLNNIYASVPVIGTATGNGTVLQSGALDFRLTAKFNNSSVVGAVANSGLNALGGLLGNRSSSAANNGIPLTITGTTANPSIRADVGALLKQQTGGLFGGNSQSQQKSSNTVQKLKGLFGR